MARQYVLSFRNTTGTDGDDWNTIRLGPAWSKRLLPGVRVPLYDKEGAVYAHARVLRIECGPRDDIIRAHAARNHLYLGRDPETSGEHLLKLMPRLYGNLIFKNNDRATVIYMRTER